MNNHIRINPTKNKKQFIGFFKPSLMFSILAGIVVVIFGAAMINLMSMPSYEEKREQQNKQALEQHIIDAANKAGVPYEQFKQQQDNEQKKRQEQWQRDSVVQKIKSELLRATTTQDNLVFEQALEKLNVSEVEKFISDIYSYAIKNNHAYAFSHLLEKSIPCDYESKTGKQAFVAAANSIDSNYLKALIEYGCETKSETNTNKLIDLILQSKNQHYILLLPDAEISLAVLNTLLLKAVQSSSTDVVNKLISLGADPNNKSNHQSALYLSLSKDQIENTIILLKNGAKIDRTVMSKAVRDGHIEVVHVMLKSDAEYIQSDGNVSAVLESISFKNDLKIRKELIKLLIENGVDFGKLNNTGTQFLIKAVEYQDADVVGLLLNHGVNPRKHFKFKTALGSAKKLEGKNKDNIIKLLKLHDATDDVLEIVREENNLSKNIKCELGGKVNYVQSHDLVKRIAKKRETNAKEFNEPELVCGIAGMDCANQGFGFDDCMFSVPECSDDDSENQTICCENEFKSQYFNARCSGLSVKETFDWLGF